MTKDDSETNNVIPFGGHAELVLSLTADHLNKKARHLELTDLKLRRKARKLDNLERAFEHAHANLEKRIVQRTLDLVKTNAQLREKTRESARLEAAFGKVISNLEQHIEDRAAKLLRSQYSIGSKIIEGPGREAKLHLVGQDRS